MKPQLALAMSLVWALMVGHRRLMSRSCGWALVALILVPIHQQHIFAAGNFDIVIHPGPALATNGPALAALNRAADAWKAFIADPIVIHINSNLDTLGSGILGSTVSGHISARHSDLRNAMINDAANEADDAIVSWLPVSPSFTLPANFTLNVRSLVTRANAKALGLWPSNTTDDAQITFSNSFPFDFDPSNGITAGQFDFETVARHEIGHVLGFESAVDYVDSLPSAANVNPLPLDWFRFDNDGPNDPATVADFQTFPRSLVPGNDEIFDQIIAGQGGSVEVPFSTGVNKGDGRQASHWKDNLGLGNMDPALAKNETLLIGQNDLRALDLIGYEISIVPETRGLTLLTFGVILAIGCRWRRA